MDVELSLRPISYAREKAVEMRILRSSIGHDAGIGRYVLLMIGNGSRALVLSIWKDRPSLPRSTSVRSAC